MPRHSAALMLLAMAGCASAPPPAPEPVPTLIKVPVTRYVPVPAELTEPCPIKRATERTVEAVVSAYNANVSALEACNADKAAIRKLEGSAP